MAQLWQKTAELFRRHPALWVPVLVAAMASYLWARLREFLLHWALPWIVRGGGTRSVLTEQVFSTRSSAVRESLAFVVGFFISYGCQFADVCCFVIAILWTVKLVSRHVASPQPEIEDRYFSKRIPGVLTLSLKAYLLALFSAGMLLLPQMYWFQMKQHRPYTASLGVVLPPVLLMYLALAYFLSPSALKLIKGKHGQVSSPRGMELSRKFALATALAMTALSAIQLEIKIQPAHEGWERTLIALLMTVLVAIPYTPLFIAWALIILDEHLETNDVTCAIDMAVEPTP